MVRLNRSLIISVLIIEINFIIDQIFNLGKIAYKEGVNLGGSNIEVTYILAYSIVLFPLIFQLEKDKVKRRIYSIIIIIAFAICILVFRRGPLIIIGLSYIYYGFRFRNKLKFLRNIVFSLLALSTILAFYFQEITKLFELRTEFSSEYYSVGGRFGETTYVFEKFINGDYIQKLFGRELFNSKSFYGSDMALGYVRVIHIDYNILLNGAGIIGLLFYLALIFLIYRKFKMLSTNTLHTSKFSGYLTIVFPIFIISSLILSATNQLWAISSFSFFFAYCGALLGVLKNAKRSNSFG